MDCPHCGIAFHEVWIFQKINRDQNFLQNNKPSITDEKYKEAWSTKITSCPSCKEATIFLRRHLMDAGRGFSHVLDEIQVYPANRFRGPIPTEVPEAIKIDYEEACRVISISHKASAALSRRCLQSLLIDQGYTQKDLAKQIDALLAEHDPAKAIPTSLRQTVDTIRNFGNFSAHRITDLTTLQIIDVEEHEAEQCLNVLNEMFDHYFVKPAKAAALRSLLNAKLLAAGKPPLK